MFGFCFSQLIWCIFGSLYVYILFLALIDVFLTKNAICLFMNIFTCCSVLCVKYLNFLRSALVVLLLCRLMVVWSCQTKLLCVLLRLKMLNIRKTKLNVSSPIILSTLSPIAFIKKSFGFSNFDWVIYLVLKFCLGFLLSFLQFGIMYMDLI